MCRAFFLLPTQNMLRLLEVAPAQDWLPAMTRFYWNLERPGHYPQTGNRHRACLVTVFVFHDKVFARFIIH